MRYIYEYMAQIQGLSYQENFLTIPEENELVKNIDNQKWSNALKRRVQHYGHVYEYKNAVNNQDNKAIEIPDFLLKLFEKVKNNNYARDVDISTLQIIVNEYLPGQGIHHHVDDPVKFGEWIVGVNLGSNVMMEFKNKTTGEITKQYLHRRSIYEMKDDARYNYSHSILGKKTDSYRGFIHHRSRRVSITFRYMK